MTDFLMKLFLKNKEGVDTQRGRSVRLTFASIVGISLNVLLFAGKLTVGLISGSVAIVADAFNNIADAGSSIVALIGFKLSEKHVDKEHPFGHGRMEYVAGFIVDMLIILVGFELFTGSIEKIMSPSVPTFKVITVVILSVSVLIKVWLFFFYRGMGKATSSETLMSTATDSISDAGATTIVLISLIVAHYFDIAIDGYVGIAVAILILIAGIKSAKGTIDLLLGVPPTPEYIKEIEEFALSAPSVIGAHDIMVHDYGVGRKIISFHAEIPSDMDINHAHEEIDQLERDMHERFGAIITIHLDPLNVNDEELEEMKKVVGECVRAVDERFVFHDFRMTKGETYTNLIFDLVIPSDYKGHDDDAVKAVTCEIKKHNENYFAVIKPEHPFY